MAEPAPSRGRPAASEAPLIAGRIVAAAWAVLLESGPEQFSLDRVASAAHASKQTIYARFSGKLELFEAVLAARVGSMFEEFAESAASGDVETVIAEVTRRSATSLSAPEAMMLERLIDWIDAARAGTGHAPMRAAIYGEMHALLRRYLADAVAQAHIAIDDIDSAATFWLDGLIGHIRGLPRGERQLSDWSRTFARYFLRAVSGRG